MSEVERWGRRVETLLGEVPSERIERGRAAFVHHAALTPAPRRVVRLRQGSLLAAAALLAAVLGLVFWRYPHQGDSPGLAQVVESRDIRAGSDRAVRVALAEHSTVELQAGTRARLEELSDGSGRLLLEGGRVDVDIEPTGKRWSFVAGPFDITVLGTAFRIRYSPDDVALEVAVSRGRVRVEGMPLGGDVVTLSAGQRLQADARGIQVTRVEAAVGSASSVPSSVAPGAPQPTGRVQAPVAEPPAQTGWHELFDRGDYRAAFATAEREGLDGIMRTVDADELSDLADAARLAGRAADSAQILRVLRERFPGSEAAGRAAFLLGRASGNPADAARWFELCLAEHPAGVWAGEARGRLMVAYRDLGQPERARAMAREYLRLQPKGAYAKVAHEIVE